MSYKYIVKQGDLLSEENATFIVNASNTRLLLGSGVSMAFKRHCGLELQKEMTTQLDALDHPLKKGDVIMTSSGSANNFKYALHAAVMDYNQGARGIDKLPILEDIKSALNMIESYLEWYSQEQRDDNIKLVVPLMGCGVGGLNKGTVIELYNNFFKRNILFECIVVIYGYSEEDFEMIKSTMN
ncbi:MAG: macro domain-containing protein [Sulfurimonas sp.]|jgi:O-acetyl-ADP-ribose deacetylase (regulator of RNase III)|nr:macro domain-containing protein [Sulfurimonas sp.]